MQREHLFHRFERAAFDKDSKTAEEFLLLRTKQIIAPLEGSVQRLLTFGKITRPTSQEPEAPLQPCQQCWEGEQLETSYRQFDGQWESFQANTNLGNDARIGTGHLEIWLNGLRSLEEQGDSGILGNALDIWQLLEVWKSQG